MLLAIAAAAAIAPAVAVSETTPTVEAFNASNGSHSWKPPSVTISEGGSINVTNPTAVPHGVEFHSGPATPSCTSGVPVGNNPGASGTHWSGSCTFAKAGTYVFFCTVHGSEMTETVTVNTAGGTPPAVTKVKPTNGGAAGGTTVTITGTGFTGATAVKFGATSAASFKVGSATSLTAVSPAETPGLVDITVTTPAGTSALSSADHFKFTPTITALNPNTGPAAGGTSVNVTGAGFALGTTATKFMFGTAKATSVNCTSSTECKVSSPAHAAGKVDVKATVNKQSSPKTAADQFTYS
jgi:large repetitive protein